MKRTITLSALLGVCALPIGAPAATTAAAPAATSAPQAPAAGATIPTVSVLLPAGTPVPLHVLGLISSGSAKVGDAFQIAVASDVVVNGMVVIAKGAGGQGEITAADTAGGNGHSGSLAMQFDYVYAADGGRVRLTEGSQTQAEDDRKGASSTATILGFATLGLGGLFAHNFAHGREKTIDPHATITAYVGQTVHVDASDHGIVDHYDK